MRFQQTHSINCKFKYVGQNKLVRLIKKVTFKQRLERGEGITNLDSTQCSCLAPTE